MKTYATNCFLAACVITHRWRLAAAYRASAAGRYLTVDQSLLWPYEGASLPESAAPFGGTDGLPGWAGTRCHVR